LQRRKTTEWKERHITNPLFGKGVDQRIILPVCDIVKVLDADDRRDRLRLGDLLGAHITHPEMLNQTRVLHFRKHAERLSNRTGLRCNEATDPQIDHIERVDTEIVEIVTNRLPKFVRSERSGPISFRVAAGADV